MQPRRGSTVRKEGRPDLADALLQAVEFFGRHAGRFFLQTQLVGGGAVDKLGVFENMSHVLVEHGRTDQGLDQADVVGPPHQLRITVGMP